MNTQAILLNYFGNRLVLNKDEVSEYLGYSPHTIQKYLEHGDTHLNDVFFKAGKSWKADLMALADFIDAGHHKNLKETLIKTNGKVRAQRLTSPLYN